MANNADSAHVGYYNNLGQALSEMGEADSAFFYFERSLQACRRYGNDRLFALHNSMASLIELMLFINMVLKFAGNRGILHFKFAGNRGFCYFKFAGN